MYDDHLINSIIPLVFSAYEYDMGCLQVEKDEMNLSLQLVYSFNCSLALLNRRQHSFIYHSQNHFIQHEFSQLCLTALNLQTFAILSLEQCYENNLKQQFYYHVTSSFIYLLGSSSSILFCIDVQSIMNSLTSYPFLHLIPCNNKQKKKNSIHWNIRPFYYAHKNMFQIIPVNQSTIVSSSVSSSSLMKQFKEEQKHFHLLSFFLNSPYRAPYLEDQEMFHVGMYWGSLYDQTTYYKYSIIDKQIETASVTKYSSQWIKYCVSFYLPKKKLQLLPCYTSSHSMFPYQQWEYYKDEKLIVHLYYQKCLQYDPSGSSFFLKSCDHKNTHQKFFIAYHDSCQQTSCYLSHDGFCSNGNCISFPSPIIQLKTSNQFCLMAVYSNDIVWIKENLISNDYKNETNHHLYNVLKQVEKINKRTQWQKKFHPYKMLMEIYAISCDLKERFPILKAYLMDQWIYHSEHQLIKLAHENTNVCISLFQQEDEMRIDLNPCQLKNKQQEFLMHTKVKEKTQIQWNEKNKFICLYHQKKKNSTSLFHALFHSIDLISCESSPPHQQEQPHQEQEQLQEHQMWVVSSP